MDLMYNLIHTAGLYMNTYKIMAMQKIPTKILFFAYFVAITWFHNGSGRDRFHFPHQGADERRE
jgi:hypothetical protein